MKKIIISLIFVVAIFGGYLLYQKPASPLVYNAAQDAFISTFFTYAQKQIPTLSAEIEKLEGKPKKEDELYKKKKQLNFYTAVDIIANRDIDSLQKLDIDKLTFDYHQIWAQGDLFDPKVVDEVASFVTGNPVDMAEKKGFSSAIIGGDALAFVIFNSARDKNPEDKQKTLAMMKILLEKKMDPTSMAGIAFWVKAAPDSNTTFDYPLVLELARLALDWSSPEALELLLKNGARFCKDFVDRRIKENQAFMTKSNLRQFEKVFQRYPNQGIRATGEGFLSGCNLKPEETKD